MKTIGGTESGPLLLETLKGDIAAIISSVVMGKTVTGIPPVRSSFSIEDTAKVAIQKFRFIVVFEGLNCISSQDCREIRAA